jgi:RimJ/RimL family protein N-acetyltransferase
VLLGIARRKTTGRGTACRAPTSQQGQLPGTLSGKFGPDASLRRLRLCRTGRRRKEARRAVPAQRKFRFNVTPTISGRSALRIPPLDQGRSGLRPMDLSRHTPDVMAVQEYKKCVDKMGATYYLAPASMEDLPAIQEMYDGFSPKAVTQGLPPADRETCLKWVRNLLESGHNFVALKEGKVIGHSSLVMNPQQPEGEYLIFVSRQFRNRGLGTHLTRLAVERAAELGFTSVWLTVEALNFRAIKLYKKIGFVFCDSGERERTMVLRL